MYRRHIVHKALLCLKKHNPLYQNIVIECNRLEQLPIDGLLDIHENMVNDTHSTSPDFGSNQDLPDDFESASFIPTAEGEPTERNRLSETFDDCLDIGSTPFNEFSTLHLASLAFPTLFPDGKGDPSDSQQIREISENQTECFASKLKHFLRFGEFKNGSWVFRFASHPRFGYWAYNMLQRKRLLGQGNFYIKHNFGEYLPRVDELCEMLHSSSCRKV